MRKPACVLLAVALSLAGCGAYKLHPYELDEARFGAPGVEAVGLLPLNVFATLPPELDSGAQGVGPRIRDHLEACGRYVVPFTMGEVRRLWSEVSGGEARETLADGAGAEAVARLVQRLRQVRKFDVLVAPNVVYREARIRLATQVAVWDGVTRELAVEGYHHEAGWFRGDTKLQGATTGVSLHVLVYDASGERVFDSYGGLDLIHVWEFRTEWRMDSNHHRYAVPVYDVRLKRKRLADEAHLREGVAMAFHPYLVPAGEAATAAAGAR